MNSQSTPADPTAPISQLNVFTIYEDGQPVQVQFDQKTGTMVPLTK